MPNYVLSQKIRQHIKTQATVYAQRAMQLALQDFPLTTAQVQYGGAMLTEEQVNVLRRLDGEGVRTIEHHRQVRLALLHENFPELRRAVVLNLQLPEWIVVGRGTQWGISTTKFDASENHYLVPRFDNISVGERKSFITWVNQALRQVRLFEIVTCTLTEVFDNPEIVPTTSHLHVLWPMLATMVDPARSGWPQEREMLEMWVQRLRNPTRSFKRYAPEPRIVKAYGALMTAADVQIAAGMMLPPIVADRSQIQVLFEHWERLPGDPTFPVAVPEESA